MRADFHLTIISLFGVATMFGITPFAVFRFATGNVVVGVIDSALVIGICAVVVYAWRTGDTRRSGLIVAIFSLAGAVAVSSLLGPSGLFWMAPTLLASFFLVNRRVASVLSALSVAFLAFQGGAFAGFADTASFVVSAVLVSLFAFIFAARSESQRRQLEQLAGSDSLTGVDNRRSMEQELQNSVAAFARRPECGFGLVILDLDHFKLINDQHGHEAGDQVLVAFAELLRSSTRSLDRLFRFGGEEFVLLLPGTDLAGLRQAASKLRHRIADGLHGPSGVVTSSLGAALLRTGEDWPAWLARADAALYQAKRAGRDCVVIDESPFQPLPVN